MSDPRPLATLVTKAIDAITQDNDSDGALEYLKQAHRWMSRGDAPEAGLDVDWREITRALLDDYHRDLHGWDEKPRAECTFATCDALTQLIDRAAPQDPEAQP